MLVLCVVTGSVFATWTYTNNEATNADTKPSISITDKTEKTDLGTFTITPDKPVFQIDNDGNYKMKWVPTGSYKVEFTENPGKPAGNIKLTWSVSAAAVPQVNLSGSEEPLYTITPGETEFNSGDTISAADIAGKLTLSTTPVDTEAKYDLVSNALSSAQITITFKASIEA